jgi:hypothetical protein
MGRRKIFIAVVVLAGALLSACVAPPTRPVTSGDQTFPVIYPDDHGAGLMYEVTVEEPTASMTVAVTPTVVGQIRVCTLVRPRLWNPPWDVVESWNCKKINAAPGVEQIVTIPVTSPTGEYPYEGVIGLRTDLEPTTEPPSFVFGKVVATSGADLGCRGQLYFEGESFECYATP